MLFFLYISSNLTDCTTNIYTDQNFIYIGLLCHSWHRNNNKYNNYQIDGVSKISFHSYFNYDILKDSLLPEPPSPPAINLKRMERSPRFDESSTPERISNAADNMEDSLECQSNVDNTRMLGE